MIYFRAEVVDSKGNKTGEIAEGDFANVLDNNTGQFIPYIVRHRRHGGQLYISKRWRIDIKTLKQGI